MRRLTAGVLAVCLLAFVAVPAVAQEPSPEPPPEPPPWFGGRVEMPEHGYAITFPEDWYVVRQEQAQVGAMSRVGISVLDVDPEVGEQVMAMDYVASTRGIGSNETCSMAVGSTADDPLFEPSVAVETLAEVFGDSITDGPRAELLVLDSGQVLRVDVGLRGGGVDRQLAIFRYDRDELYWELTCGATERPSDDWLSIAETFEFLPAEE